MKAGSAIRSRSRAAAKKKPANSARHKAEDFSGRVEAALQRAGAYNRRLIEASLDPLVTIGSDGKITDVNRATEAVTGLGRGELIGTDFSAYFTDPEKAESGYREVFEKGQVRDFALELKHRDGHVTPVLYNASVYLDETGQVIGVFAAARDVTARRKAEEELLKHREHLEELVRERTTELGRSNRHLEQQISVREHAEKALRESEEIYRSLVETSPDVIVLTDLQGQILKANRKAVAGYGEEGYADLVGRNVVELIAPRDRARFADLRSGLLESGVLAGLDLEILRKDGSSFQGELSASVIQDAQGQPKAVVGVVRDVTERKQMQARLAQADRLASVGVLAAGVAHEINNPLAYVLFSLQNVANELPKLTAGLSQAWSLLNEQLGFEKGAEALGPARELCEQGRLDDLVTQIRDAAEGAARIRDIVRDLKVFAHIENERHLPVSLSRVLNTTINIAQNEIKFRARLVKDFGELPVVLATEGRLSQVFLNLLVNAAQAIDEGNVDGNEIRVRGWVEGEEVLIEVSDTGRGIAPEHLDRVFDPFFTTKAAGVGSGLGLSICHNIIGSLNGRIDVESKLGKGTRFVVHLHCPPVEPQAAAGPVPLSDVEPVPELVPATERSRILVVDDEPLIGSLIKRIFEREHDLVIATSGREGQGILEKERGFDLVLCDMMMPDFSGMDLFDWLAGVSPQTAERVVFLTGGAFTPRAGEFLKRASNAIVDKPFDPKKLQSLVRGLLDRRGNRSAQPRR